MMDTSAKPLATRLDPVDFEILRHRLWAINDESSATVRLVSGSPVATETSDMNTSMMDAAGDAFVVGCYSLAKASTMTAVVKDILRNYQDNPGIREGDAFICNDPYVGAQHQNDTALVMPVFVDGNRIAWTGAELHLIDVGGPTAGQVQIDAQDIFGEAPLVAPVKILEGDVLRRDIEREYLRRSRLPELMGLDLRAKVAAATVARRRLQEVAAEYGTGMLCDAMADMLDYAETRFRQRLGELPDGVWRHRTYIEFMDDVHTVYVTMRKEGDELTFDFTGTSKQAPAIINATREALEAIVKGNMCTLLCWGLPWCPSAIGRAIHVVTEPGTLVDAQWPAGVSKSTTTTLWALGKTMTVLVGKMLLSSEKYAERAMASWQGSLLLEELFGETPDGKRFGGTMLDMMAGGSGARTMMDGIDSGGYIGSMRIGIANVETYEAEYPILYLWRREEADSGGAGTFRGGNGVSLAYVAHGTDRIDTKIVHGIGVEQPMSSGISGGYPGAPNRATLKRRTNIKAKFAGGVVPQSLDELTGEVEFLPPIVRTSQDSEDVYMSMSVGGGGFGDPLLREPARVLADVRSGAVTSAYAGLAYGVVIVESNGEPAVDAAATVRARDDIRQARRSAASQP
jgi:N-methylhydantoinase B